MYASRSGTSLSAAAQAPARPDAIAGNLASATEKLLFASGQHRMRAMLGPPLVELGLPAASQPRPHVGDRLGDRPAAQTGGPCALGPDLPRAWKLGRRQPQRELHPRLDAERLKSSIGHPDQLRAGARRRDGGL